MRLLVDIVAKQWLAENPIHDKTIWLNTCWEMYKKTIDEPSRVILQGAIDDVMKLSDGIVMLKIDTEKEQDALKRGII